jgi:hypothetical protein
MALKPSFQGQWHLAKVYVRLFRRFESTNRGIYPWVTVFVSHGAATFNPRGSVSHFAGREYMGRILMLYLPVALAGTERWGILHAINASGLAPCVQIL